MDSALVVAKSQQFQTLLSKNLPVLTDKPRSPSFSTLLLNGTLRVERQAHRICRRGKPDSLFGFLLRLIVVISHDDRV